MFLALKEMKKEKNRFLMIILVTTLIAYLVFFLTGLAFGLAKANTTAIEAWNGEGIILSKSANENIYASTINEEVYQKISTEKLEPLNVQSAVITVNGQEAEQYNLVFMGVEEPSSSLIPEIVEGKAFTANNEMILSESFKEKMPIKLGDTIKIVDVDRSFKIVGFSKKAQYNTQDVGYVNLEMASKEMMVYKGVDDQPDAVTTSTPNMPKNISALVVSKPVDKSFLKENKLVYLPMADFIDSIPGYQAQVLTFGLMIISLVVISAIIIGIFMYILTMQKKAIFAILKIQGISNGFISRSVLVQTFLISILGSAVGFLLTLVTFYFLPPAVPVQISWFLFSLIFALLLACSLIGTIFSARSVLKISPLTAL